jgi:hypothetical protein
MQIAQMIADQIASAENSPKQGQNIVVSSPDGYLAVARTPDFELLRQRRACFNKHICVDHPNLRPSLSRRVSLRLSAVLPF